LSERLATCGTMGDGEFRTGGEARPGQARPGQVNRVATVN